MAAPGALFTRIELETAYTAEVVNQLLSADGKSVASDARVDLVRRSATGDVLGKIQIALKTTSIDEWWDASTTTERDKAEIKRLALSAGNYYLRHYGQKGEDMPEATLTEMERIERRCTEIAEHHATIASNTQPASSTPHQWAYVQGPTDSPAGSPRSRFRGFC